MHQLEICVDTLSGAVAAIEGGADRLEVCGSLTVGGTTPSVGLVLRVNALVSSRREEQQGRAVSYRVMLRPREGDFCYDENEKSVMMEDARRVLELDLDSHCFEGFVIGATSLDSMELDLPFLRELPLSRVPVGNTLHRVSDLLPWIDASNNHPFDFTILKEFRIDTILTSGGTDSCLDGVPNIAHLSRICQPLGITVMPGSGIRAHNAARLIQAITSANPGRPPSFLHASARLLQGLQGSEFNSHYVTSLEEVSALRNIIDTI
eukprot:Protomagalhaensia_sp_Gyna_25__5887@NODE_890_length_2454_cov_2027_515942_g703_i0_p1_GENE_NODE_890_length_2454_cov_2027_515942_g703_i0NODE_890_length_2454_cov_2027_515942_g703_i0_p1_ORF_typecomplete_len264_score56_15CutC/PF03932_14/5_7e45_NODE_890_length_2454_cov_2027_515942_g703_i08471638